MATKREEALGWAQFKVATFAGQHNSHIRTGEDYPAITLGSIFTMEPQCEPKMSGLAFLPSSYCDYDARSHEAQRAKGSFVALTGDIDKGDLTLEHVREATERFTDGAAWLIYSSAHSRPGDRRWRIVIPLASPIPFLEWFDAQTAFFTYMEEAGCIMDRALSRAGQPVYLPNVPEAYKDGTPLRDENGALYYDSQTSSMDAPGLDISRGIIAGGIASIKRQRAADDRTRDEMRRAAEKRHAARKQEGGDNLIDSFNASTSIPAMLEMCGYKQSPRSSEDWRSPQQTGETYATRIIEDKWVSLSGSDAASGLGQPCRTGCFGDAYDLYVHYKHNGQHKDAYREIGREMRGNNVVYGDFGNDEYANRPSAPDYIEDYRDEDPEALPEIEEEQPQERLIKATPFAWRSESEIPKRQWLYGKHLLRKFLSVDVAAGGVGKSSLKIGEALSMASGRDFYGQTLHEGELTVWLYNLEDPEEETERRIHATAKRFEIKPDDFGDRLYADSGRVQPCVIAEETPNGVQICRPVVESMIAELLERGIDVLVIDPFVSSHNVSENDNIAIDKVAKQWAAIADAANCSINLVHHVRKQNGEAATADSARGASSLVSAARSVMVFNRMTKDEAERVGVSEDEMRFFFRVDNDKANLAPPTSTTWYRMNNVDLDNGDSVGVACPWKMPDLFAGVSVHDLMRMQKLVGAGEWRENSQASAWVGNPVAEALRLDVGDQRDKKRISMMIKEWIRNGILEVVEDEDQQRRKRKFVVVGKWVTE